MKLAEFALAGQVITDLPIRIMGDFLLGMEALRGMKLHLEALSFRGNPPGVDALVLRVLPGILAQVHLMPAVFQSRLDVVVAPGVSLEREAERVADSIRN